MLASIGRGIMMSYLKQQKMDHNVDTTTIEDFDIRPSKKAKSSE